MPRRAALIAVLALVLVAPQEAAAAGLAYTQKVLGRQMAASGSASGAYVIDLDSGAPLYASNPDVQRIPASVNKLFTTSSALQRFGPDATLHTDVLAQIAPDATGVIAGDVYLRGGGDPTFTTRDARTLARTVAATGVTAVTGRVIGDESAWDALRGGPGSSYLTSYWVGPLSALTLDRGFVSRRFQTNPPRTAAQAFAKALRRAGIAVPGKARTGITPDTATPLTSWPSPTIGACSKIGSKRYRLVG